MAGSAVAVVCFILAGLAINAASKSDPKAAANVACKQFERVEARDVDGAIVRSELVLQLGKVVDAADSAGPVVRASAREVYRAATKGTASETYRLAVTHMSAACGQGG